MSRCNVHTYIIKASVVGYQLVGTKVVAPTLDTGQTVHFLGVRVSTLKHLGEK